MAENPMGTRYLNMDRLREQEIGQAWKHLRLSIPDGDTANKKRKIIDTTIVQLSQRFSRKILFWDRIIIVERPYNRLAI